MEISEIMNRAGGVRAVADKFGISVAAVYSWDKVPPARVGIVAEMIGVSVHEIRPDLFPADAAHAK
jgi:hypothetical protein